MKAKIITILTLVLASVSCSGVNLSTDDKTLMREEQKTSSNRLADETKGMRPCSTEAFQAHKLHAIEIEGWRGLQFSIGFETHLNDALENSMQLLGGLVHEGQTVCKNGFHSINFYEKGFSIHPFYIKKIGSDRFSLHQKVEGVYSEALKVFNQAEMDCRDQNSDKCWISLKQNSDSSGVDTVIRFSDPETGLEKQVEGKFFFEEAPTEQIYIGE